MEIKCQLDATQVFIADLIACSTCFGHHYAHHQELKSIIQWLLRVVFCAVVFSSSRSGVELRVMCAVCRMLKHPADRTHNPQPAFKQDPVLLESYLQTCMTYTIVGCTVNKVLMMDRGTVRNV